MHTSIEAPKGPTPPANLVGRIRRFGSHGVPYEVIGIVSPTEVRIHVIPTGEETNYPLADHLTDPED